MRHYTRRSLLLTTSIAASSLAGCESFLGTGTGESSVEVVSVEAEPTLDSADGLVAGAPTTIRVAVRNQGSTAATKSMTLTVDGRELVTETVTVEAASRHVWTWEYVFRKTGSLTLSVNGISQDISVAEGPVTERTITTTGYAAESESASKGVVEVRMTADNPHDQTAFFGPLVRVDGERVPVRETNSDSDPPTRIPPGENAFFLASKAVTADASYTATVDGNQAGSVDLQSHDTPYDLGTPGRTGPEMPSGGIGTEPRLVADFSFGEPKGVPDIEELINVRLQAITEDRVYLSIRWRRSDGEIWSIAALDRWSGDTVLHLPTVPPAEVAVIGDTEYTLSAVNRDRMTLTARAMDQTEQWQREFGIPEQAISGTNLVPVPAENILYVTTPDGVAELNADTGETQRTLPGVFAMVGENAVFTFGGEGPLSKFPRDGSTTTADWQRTPGNGTRETGAVANGQVYVSSFSGGEPTDYQYQFHTYDSETGEHQWDVIASQSDITAVGVRLPQLPTLTVRNGYAMWGGGQNIVAEKTGREFRTDRIRGGYTASPLGPRRVYGVDQEEFFVSTFLPEASGQGRSVPGRNAVTLPEPLGESRVVDMLYGRGVMYVATADHVYGYSGTTP